VKDGLGICRLREGSFISKTNSKKFSEWDSRWVFGNSRRPFNSFNPSYNPTFLIYLEYNTAPMYQKDYILRMVEMLADMIALILGLAKKGDYVQASERLSRVYYDMLKQDASFFRTIPEEELTNKLLKEHDYNNGHLEILAELFNAEAELEFVQGNREGSLEYSRKSLMLFEFIDKELKTYSAERINKMKSIRDRVEALLS
jgi:hypothetical protein